MSSRRVLKAAAAVREVVSMAILTDLKDPRVRDVTVTSVEVSGDLRRAKVHVSVMGDDSAQQLTLSGLRAAAGFLQSKLNERIETRYTPRLEFVLDQGVKKSIAVAEILKRVLPEEDAPAADEEIAAEDADVEATDADETEPDSRDSGARRSPSEEAGGSEEGLHDPQHRR